MKVRKLYSSNRCRRRLTRQRHMPTFTFTEIYREPVTAWTSRWIASMQGEEETPRSPIAMPPPPPPITSARVKDKIRRAERREGRREDKRVFGIRMPIDDL